MLERYPYLGGLASGGMVLVLDDMCNGQEIAVRGLCADLIARLERLGLAVTPPEADRRSDAGDVAQMVALGRLRLHLASEAAAHRLCRGLRSRRLQARVQRHGRRGQGQPAPAQLVQPRHRRGRRDQGRRSVESKEGRQAILGKIVVDATGDLDVAASAGAPFIEGAYIVTTVFRLGGVDIDEAERFEYEEPEAFKAIDREAKRLIGGSWDKWWLKTPLPGVVWCNCPHMANYDGLKVDDLTRADFEGRKRIAKLVDYLHAKMPGFRDCFVVDVAPQLGIRQTRLLEGLYVVTKEDVTERRHFADSVARGRDYYYALPLAAAARGQGPDRRRPALFGDLVGPAHVARDPALHGDGRGGRRGGGAGAGRRRRARSRRRRQAAGAAARAAAPIRATGRPPTPPS